MSFPPPDPVLQRCAKGTADPAAPAELGRLWQQRVRQLLLDLANDPGVFTVRRVERHVGPPSRDAEVVHFVQPGLPSRRERLSTGQ